MGRNAELRAERWKVALRNSLYPQEKMLPPAYAGVNTMQIRIKITAFHPGRDDFEATFGPNY